MIFGVPSNLVLARFGARRWLAAIMIAWGLISASMVFITGPQSFYALRFLLGAAEAGFFPGIILYLTWWFPSEERTRVLALFLTATSLAYVAGGPLSGGLLELDGLAGLDGWQWLFLWRACRRSCSGSSRSAISTSALTKPSGSSPRSGPTCRSVARELRGDGGASDGDRAGAALVNGQVWLLGLIYFILLARRLRPHLLRARPGAGPHRLQRLRGGRARRACPSGSPRWPCSWWPGAPSSPPAASPTSQASRSSVPRARFSRPRAVTGCCSRVGISLAATGLLGAIPVFWALPTAS